MRRRGRLTAMGAGALSLASWPQVAAAQAADLPVSRDTILLVMLAGLTIFAVVMAVLLLARRDRLQAENAELREQIGKLRAEADRAEALVSEPNQRLVAWTAEGEAALVTGSLPAETGAPREDEAFLEFASWLDPQSAERLLRAIAELQTNAAPFIETLRAANGRLIEVRGWVTGGAGALRFRDPSGDRRALAELKAVHAELERQVGILRNLLAAAALPVWVRDRGGSLSWVNRAYAKAVEAEGPEAAVNAALELFDEVGRQAIAATARGEKGYSGRLPAIVTGSRRVYEVAAIVDDGGAAGLAVDVTVAEEAEARLRREIAFNARTLDQLQTAVAIFGPDRRMRSYNAAYRALFDLDTPFLESAPDEGTVLERLRAARKLPEQPDFRAWKTQLLAAYQSPEAQEAQWHLPDGRTLRVIANPHPGGGMTWIYENVTERLHLESRYNALKSMQGETLDHLAEGVAVFASNGRLRLHNPSFAEIWSLERELLGTLPHVSDVVALCREPDSDAEVWRRFTTAVAGVDESRSGVSGRLERGNGRVVDYATVPLPDGQTMVTFVDVTDSANMERALIERNDALEAADRLKNEFIRHVSYELRSPLTNIIGFAQLLTEARVGPLNEKQSEYISYVLTSSNALLAIINDILDLTTVDAGVMELDISEVGVADLVEEVLDELSDRIEDRQIELGVTVAPGAGRIVADRKRLHQVLYNLMVNAIEYSDAGGRVSLSAERRDDVICLKVEDYGAGMPSAFVQSAFERFSSMPRGSSRGGAGLGLAIVKSFVELHGGEVHLDSDEGKGTSVVITLPLRPRIAAAAAE